MIVVTETFAARRSGTHSIYRELEEVDRGALEMASARRMRWHQSLLGEALILAAQRSIPD